MRFMLVRPRPRAYRSPLASHSFRNASMQKLCSVEIAELQKNLSNKLELDLSPLLCCMSKGSKHVRPMSEATALNAFQPLLPSTHIEFSCPGIAAADALLSPYVVPLLLLLFSSVFDGRIDRWMDGWVHWKYAYNTDWLYVK